jgi:hypothetical protein
MSGGTLDAAALPGPDAPRPAPPRPVLRHMATLIATVAVLGVGVAAGAGGMAVLRPGAEMAPAQPVAIGALPSWGGVTIKGRVSEIFGNKFIVADETGRALVETGPAGEGGGIVAKDEAVTVQGRAEDGFVHAGFIVHGDGRVEAVRPPGPLHPPGWLRHLVDRRPAPIAGG